MEILLLNIMAAGALGYCLAYVTQKYSFWWWLQAVLFCCNVSVIIALLVHD